MPRRAPIHSTVAPAAATPMAYARAIVAAYDRHGQSPSNALKLAQITPSQLRHEQGRITARQIEVLSEEGASLQQIKDEVRCERAKDLLYRTDKPVKQLAAAVGFRNEKSFVRAFKAWAGMGPAAFRKAAE